MADETKTDLTPEQMAARIAELEGRLAKGGSISFKVSEKGAVSVYGLSRFPVTLCVEQWTKLLANVDDLKDFIEANRFQAQDQDVVFTRSFCNAPGRASHGQAVIATRRARCSPRSTTGSPRASAPPISKKPRRCSTNWASRFRHSHASRTTSSATRSSRTATNFGCRRRFSAMPITGFHSVQVEGTSFFPARHRSTTAVSNQSRFRSA